MTPTRRGLLGTAALGAAALSAGSSQGRVAPRAKEPHGATLVRGADLLTMDPKLKEMMGADVLIRGDKIVAIGEGLAAADAEVIDARDMILMPGMCDGHRHTWLHCELGAVVKTVPALYQGYQDWKLKTMVSLTPHDNYLACLIGGLSAIDAGVTSILDFAHGGYTLEAALGEARGLRDSGIGGWHCFALGVDAEYKPGDTISRRLANQQYTRPAGEKHWAIAETLQSKVFTDRSAPLQFSICPSTVIDNPMEGIKAEYARVRAMGARIIPAHFVGQQLHSVREMYAAGLLGPDFQVTHGTSLDDDELRMLKDSGAMVCSTIMGEFPYVAMGLSASVHGRARAAGIPTGIGVDVPQAVTQDYFEHVRAAFWSLYLEPPGRKLAGGYTSTDVLDLATAGGARAMRLGDVTGSIAVGKRADLVLVRTDRIGFATSGTLADRVVNFAALQDIDSVWVAGRARKRGGKMLGVDWRKLKAMLAQSQARFRPLADSIRFV
jgi:cytosine/adenosine deaminase-related metal-dependent hydrolase